MNESAAAAAAAAAASPSVVLTLYSSLGARSSAALGVCVCAVYVSGVCVNLLLLVVVWAEPRLHRPMYVLLVHLCACGLLGLTWVCPLMAAHLLGGAGALPLLFCLAQAFLTNIYVGSIFSILALMALDRYVCVCRPLRYHCLVTPPRLRLALLALYALLGLTSALQVSLASGVRLCGRRADKLVCDSMVVSKLWCRPEPAVSWLGLCYVLCLVAAPCGLVVLSYVHILAAVRTQSRESQARALRTCLPHLLTFLNFLAASFFGFLSNRLSAEPPRSLSVAVCLNFFMVPPLLHPIIYGIRMREIRQSAHRVIRDKIIKGKV